MSCGVSSQVSVVSNVPSIMFDFDHSHPRIGVFISVGSSYYTINSYLHGVGTVYVYIKITKLSRLIMEKKFRHLMMDNFVLSL